PRILNQDFIAPPLEEELVTFIQELVYSGRCNMLSAIHTDQMHQPWRTFVATINMCNSRKTTRIDRLMIKHHTIRDDSLLGTLKIVSKTQDYEQYGALTPDDMINQDIKDSEAYKTYYDFATEKVPPMKARKYKKVASPSRKLSSIKEAEPVKKGKKVKRPAKKSTTVPTAGVVIRDTPGVSVSKKKAPAKTDRSKGVPDEQQRKTSGTDEETGTKPGVHEVPTYDSESENESWGDSEDDNDDDSDDDSKGDDDKADIDDDDEEEYESDDDNENVFKEEDDDLYKDVNVRSLGVEQEQERKCDEEMTNADQNVTQEQSYEQVVEDAHVMLAAS
nr:hypothetical protein [Tanacetum cinerariifolium]